MGLRLPDQHLDQQQDLPNLQLQDQHPDPLRHQHLDQQQDQPNLRLPDLLPDLLLHPPTRQHPDLAKALVDRSSPALRLRILLPVVPRPPLPQLELLPRRLQAVQHPDLLPALLLVLLLHQHLDQQQYLPNLQHLDQQQDLPNHQHLDQHPDPPNLLHQDQHLDQQQDLPNLQHQDQHLDQQQDLPNLQHRHLLENQLPNLLRHQRLDLPDSLRRYPANGLLENQQPLWRLPAVPCPCHPRSSIQSV